MRTWSALPFIPGSTTSFTRTYPSGSLFRKVVTSCSPRAPLSQLRRRRQVATHSRSSAETTGTSTSGQDQRSSAARTAMPAMREARRARVVAWHWRYWPPVRTILKAQTSRPETARDSRTVSVRSTSYARCSTGGKAGSGWTSVALLRRGRVVARQRRNRSDPRLSARAPVNDWSALSGVPHAELPRFMRLRVRAENPRSGECCIRECNPAVGDGCAAPSGWNGRCRNGLYPHRCRAIVC